MMGFRTLPEGPLHLQNVTIPGVYLGQTDDLVVTDISVANGKITEGGGTPIDMARAMLFPCFIDMHTHLDKGHIWGRAPNPDGTFIGALTTVMDDRIANWSAPDLHARINFALKCAYAHGTRAIRTHIDSIAPQDDISWGVFKEVRADWADRIALQGACLMGCDRVELDGPFQHTADLVADAGGVLGMVTYPVPDFDDRLTNMSFDAPVTVGHCCSLSTQDEARALSTLDLCAKAGLNVVSLPMCNLYLQDRHANRTPRGRGVTLVHEMKARGINVSFASDNTRDPLPDWPAAFITNPAKACGFDAPSLAPGAPADLVICNARSWTELHARPQADRIVLRDGRPIDTTLPDYAELDPLMETI